MSEVQLPRFKAQAIHGSGSVVQTVAAVVVALATVFSVIAQSKDNPKLVWALVFFALLTVAWAFGNRVTANFQGRIVRGARDRAARAQHSELMRFARRFAQFTNTGDPTNIRNIVSSFCDNDAEKCSQLCPPDYMRELSPVFVQHLVARPLEHETHFLQAVQELYALVASYNNHYVLEPFLRMRSNRWVAVNPSLAYIEGLLGTADSEKPILGPWIASLPQSHQATAEREIEDFRERWVSFLDDMRQWLEGVSESFGVGLATYIERPHKL